MNKLINRQNSCTDEAAYIEEDEFEEDKSCTLCNGDTNTVAFKGQMVCEECLDFVKDEY
jgi:hypothetical protein